jgi:hypothetical protein
MKAFSINAENRTVTEVRLGKDYKEIYTLLGEGVDMFQCVDISDNGDTIYVDEEGLLKPQDNFFLYKGYNQPLAGNGLVLGTTDEGESTSPKISLKEVVENVVFMNRYEVVQWAKRNGQ